GLDLQVDAVLLVDPLLLAVVERRVLAVGVPVQGQRDLGGGVGRAAGLPVVPAAGGCGQCQGRGQDGGGEGAEFHRVRPSVGVGWVSFGDVGTPRGAGAGGARLPVGSVGVG